MESTVIAGRYELRGPIGRGGMGAVYLANDLRFRRLVALKLLSGDVSQGDLRQRFTREALTVGALQHPNIVTIFDYGDHNGSPYIVMEYVRGESVKELIERKAPVSLARKLSMVEELCAGLAYSHKQGIVHRDVKPANLMLTEHGTLKILDFGIARIVEAGVTLASGPAFTPGYAAPEQIEGRSVDPRSDIFSVGAVCYELISGTRAFPGDSQLAVINRTLREDPLPLATVCSGVDTALDRIVSRTLRKDPGERYAEVESLRRDLEVVRKRVEATLDPTVTLRSAQADTERLRTVLADERLRERLAEIRAYLQAGNFTKAEALLSEISARGKGSIEVEKLQHELRQRRLEHEQQELARRAAQAACDRSEENLGAGAYQLALRYVEEALVQEPGNARALKLKEEAQARLEEQAKEMPAQTGRVSMPTRPARLRKIAAAVAGVLIAVAASIGIYTALPDGWKTTLVPAPSAPASGDSTATAPGQSTASVEPDHESAAQAPLNTAPPAAGDQGVPAVVSSEVVRERDTEPGGPIDLTRSTAAPPSAGSARPPVSTLPTEQRAATDVRGRMAAALRGGNASFEAADYGRAITLYEEALRLGSAEAPARLKKAQDARNFEVRLRLNSAQQLYDKADYEGALRVIDEALQLDTESADARTLRQGVLNAREFERTLRPQGSQP